MKFIHYYFKKMKAEDKEKAIKFLKENKKVKRIDFWNFLKDENIAEEILYDLYIQNKIKFEQNSSGYIIIWIGE
jgi:hypothetical protein